MQIQDSILKSLQPRLLKQATKILDNEDYAKDVVQDVWLEVLTRDNIVDIERYCRKAVTNKAIQVLRQKRYTGELSPNLGYDPYTLSDDLKEVLVMLPEPLREILDLRYVCNLSSREMAPVLGYSPATVVRRLQHARNLLAKMLELQV